MISPTLIQFQILLFPETDFEEESLRIYGLDVNGAMWTRLIASGTSKDSNWQLLDEDNNAT